MTEKDYLLAALMQVNGYPEPRETAGYTLHRNSDGSGDIQCECGCIMRIHGAKKKQLNEKQLHCKVCGGLLTKWIKEPAWAER